MSIQRAQHVWVAAKFWDDHCDRCPSDDGEEGICHESQRSGRRVLVEGDARQIETLRSDAAFYAEGNVDDCAQLVRSAQATLLAITRALGSATTCSKSLAAK